MNLEDEKYEPLLMLLEASAAEEDLTLPQYIVALARRRTADETRDDPSADVDLRTAMQELRLAFAADLPDDYFPMAVMQLHAERCGDPPLFFGDLGPD